jgi:transcription initiation factor TFIID subunit 2
MPPVVPASKPALPAHRAIKPSNTTSPIVPTTPKLKLMPTGAALTSKVKLPSALLPSNASRQGFKVPPPKKATTNKLPKSGSKYITKAQASGMSHNDLKACRNMLKKLQTHKRATIFLQPVDPVRDRAPKCVISFFLTIRVHIAAGTSISLKSLWTSAPWEPN